MSSIVANSNNYKIITETELTSILSHFNTETIFEIIRDGLMNRFKYDTMSGPGPNMVAAIENHFKMIPIEYTSIIEYANTIRETRVETYKEIIGIICSNFNLQVDMDQITEPYTIAYYLYELLVSSFVYFMVQFFAKYLYSEKNTIYESMNLGELKKSKDSTTVYGKRSYKDIKLAVIVANLGDVMNNIFGYDISFENILTTIYDKNISDYIVSYITPIQDFYKVIYIDTIIGSGYYANLITSIKFQIQSMLETTGGVIA